MIITILGLTAVAIALFILAAHYRSGYLSELINSFLPYTAALVATLLLVATLAVGELDSLEPVILAAGWLLLLLIAWPLFKFSYARPLGTVSKAADIRVASFNKLLTNDNTEAIFYHLQQLGADVAGLLEVKTVYLRQFAQLAKHHKLHMVSRRYGMAKAELVLISKYPLRAVQLKETDTFGTVLMAEVTIKRKNLRVALVHTAAPVIPFMLKERNLGLVSMAEFLAQLPAQRLVVMGDFNLTPWSKAYRQFYRSLAKRYYNLARGAGLVLTWVFLGPFGAQIDHIFATRSIKNKGFKVDQKLGSDHKLIYADLDLG